jgi:DNA-binding transcriptional ArsR family regulator
MSINAQVPDYELAEELVVTTRAEMRAMADPLRATFLDLLLERAATVGELAAAVGRPKSTVAHHVNVLVDAGMLRVVRTRRVRAIEERFYGRTARLFRVGGLTVAPALDDHPNALTAAAAESRRAHRADELSATLRRALISPDDARAFWEQVLTLAQEFARLPRSGDTMYSLAVGLYPTDHPTLPDPDPPPPDTVRGDGPPRPR